MALRGSRFSYVIFPSRKEGELSTVCTCTRMCFQVCIKLFQVSKEKRNEGDELVWCDAKQMFPLSISSWLMDAPEKVEVSLMTKEVSTRTEDINTCCLQVHPLLRRQQ